jgi:hypothetical protein
VVSEHDLGQLWATLMTEEGLRFLDCGGRVTPCWVEFPPPGRVPLQLGRVSLLWQRSFLLWPCVVPCGRDRHHQIASSLAEA